MALTGEALANLTFVGHVGLFPLSAASSRSNSGTGVSSHNPAQKLIEGLATGLVDTISSLTWRGALAGTAVPGGTAAPFVFTLPGAQAASALFLASSGWAGVSSALYVQSVVANMLTNVSILGLIQGSTSTVVGTGTGVFSIVTNPDLLAAAQASLLSTLPAALKATGVFCRDDVPGGPINAKLAESIPFYAAAYATGLSTLTAAVPYVGGASSSAGTDVVSGSIS